MKNNFRKTSPVLALVSISLGINLGFTQTAVAQDAIRGGFNQNTLPRNDDQSAPFFDLPFDLNFFGAEYEGVYVNNNGNVTFDRALSTFTPFGLANVTTPIIAPFFADVDTRNPASAQVTYGLGTVDGRQAFAANWNTQGVGYYDSRADLLNQFQLVIIDRDDTGVGNFDFEFNYEQIEWETGEASGGEDGLGGTSAAVGYSNGLRGSANNSLEFAGSRTPGTFLDNGTAPLIESSLDSGVNGRYRFVVRSGDQLPPGTTPEEPVLPNPPTPEDPAFNFDNIPIGENGFGIDFPLFFDPEVAVGYDYSVTNGPNFSSILIPDPLPNGDNEFLLELPGISNPFVLRAGITFNLLEQNAQGFSNFTIRGIAPQELLDPTDTMAFVTGLTFTEAGTVSVVQDPITENFDQPVIPEPSTILASTLLGFGFKLARRKKA